MSADRRRALRALPLLLLGACSWFTDFRDQPKYEPWETANDSTPFRANPQFSVPLNGSPAPGLLVSYRGVPQALDSVVALVGANPVPADARSLENGRKSYQINCAVCHGAAGRGDGPATKFGVIPMPIVTPVTVARSDAYIYAMIRNGRATMPTYNRIPELERWDIVNYLRGLQGRYPVVTAPAGVPGETGATLPAATELAPTRPAPYYHRVGSQAGIPLGPAGTAPALPGAATDSGLVAPASGTDTAATPTDTTTRGSQP